MHAHRSNHWLAITGMVVFSAMILWGIRHVENLWAIHTGSTKSLTLIYALSFAILAWQVLLYSLERPYKVTTAQGGVLDSKRVVANVPVCNEDPEALKQCLLSMALQTRQIDQIQVVVNGPNKVDYIDVKRYARKLIDNYGAHISWVTQEIAGKRMAQARTAKTFLGPNDFFLTIDSDAYLDSHAVEEAMKPFADKRIMSVAGVVLSMNNRASFITRMSDLWFLVGQLVDRSAASTMGSVLVNSGVLAIYRGHIFLDNVEGYTHETFFGRPVEFSDDSLLTLYALQQGKAVQQPTSFAFTLMPTNLSHHFRQQLRWMRGAFIRSWWRFKYLPMDGYAYWNHLMGWVQLLLSLGVFSYLFAWMPLMDHHLLPWLLFIPLCVGYGQGLRYLTVKRSDQSFWYSFVTYLCQPIPSLWSFFVLRFLRYYAMATCLKTGWGTRQDVEVTL